MCQGSHQKKPLDFSQLPAAVSVAKPAWVSHCHCGAVVHEDSLAVLPPTCVRVRASAACPSWGPSWASGASFQVRDLGCLGQGQPVPSLCSQGDRTGVAADCPLCNQQCQRLGWERSLWGRAASWGAQR